jgi:hypothetical protein
MVGSEWREKGLAKKRCGKPTILGSFDVVFFGLALPQVDVERDYS